MNEFEKIKRFSVEVYYRNACKTIVPGIVKFNDGSLKVTLPELASIDPKENCTVDISAFIESMDHLMVVAQIKDILNNYFKTTNSINLEIFGTLYTRYDRYMHEDKTDSFGAKVFSDFVNALNFNSVALYDAHSEVIKKLIKNSYEINQSVIHYDTIRNAYAEDFNIVCPDKGAAEKMKYADLYFIKDRNQETGKITGIKLDRIRNIKDQDYLVIDDICEGGGTFLGLAESIKEEIFKGTIPNKKINLSITHGIFSGQAIKKLLEHYDNIYVYFIKEQLYNSLSTEEQNRVHPVCLLEA